MSERFQRLMTRTGDVDWPDAGMLSHLSETSRRALLALGVPQEHSPGRRLILEGDQPTSVLVLCQGCVKVEARLENGSEALLAIRAKGDLVGEMGVIDGRPRSASVIGCGPTRVRIIRRAEFLRHLSTHADSALALNRMLVERLRQANRRRLDFTGCEASVRVARVLVEISETWGLTTSTGIRSGIALTQQELATLSGTARRTVEDTLGRLRAGRVLVTSRRGFTVTDRPALYRAAHLPS
jgi:CRP-like cAMP-binding protein